jgi:cytoskeletal protein RodZ
MNSGTILLLGVLVLGLGGFLWLAVRIAFRQIVLNRNKETPDFESNATREVSEHSEGF